MAHPAATGISFKPSEREFRIRPHRGSQPIKYTVFMAPAAVQAAFQVAAGVFAGTLPLLAVIGWAAFQQTQRLGRIESQLDELGKDLKSIGVRTATSETKIAVIESKLDGPRIIAPAASR